MTIALVGLAVVAAARGVWSPCGLSMLSTITPLGERGRGNRYAVTAAWYIVGATVGGLCLGAVLAGPAALVGGDGIASLAVVLAALVVMASDSGIVGVQLPIHRRQVNERWLDQYRGWVYGVGFGWQVGTGFATYITTAANYLLVALAIAAGSPELAVVAGAVFGLGRGLSVLLTRHVRSATDLVDLHRQVQRLGPFVCKAVVGVEGIIAVAAAAQLSTLWLTVSVGVAAVVAVVACVQPSRSRSFATRARRAMARTIEAPTIAAPRTARAAVVVTRATTSTRSPATVSTSAICRNVTAGHGTGNDARS